MVENGVTAIGVANFKFDNSVIDGPGNEVHESGIEAQNLSGTATVNNTEIRFSETDAFAVTNTDTSVNLTISGSTFRDSQTVSSGGAVNTNGEGGFQFRSFSVIAGQPSATINITSSSFLRLRTQAVQVFAQDDTIINLDITGSTLDSQADIGTGIDINSDDTATFSFNILNNPTIQSRGGAAVNITSFLDSHMERRVNNNTDIEVLGLAGIRSVWSLRRRATWSSRSTATRYRREPGPLRRGDPRDQGDAAPGCGGVARGARSAGRVTCATTRGARARTRRRECRRRRARAAPSPDRGGARPRPARTSARATGRAGRP